MSVSCNHSNFKNDGKDSVWTCNGCGLKIYGHPWFNSMNVLDVNDKIKELEAQAIGAHAANAILEAKLAERSKQIGVACLEHDLVHSLKCGRCYEIMEEKLKVAVEILEKVQSWMDKENDPMAILVDDALLKISEGVIAAKVQSFELNPIR